MGLWVVALLALGACNQVLGLEEPENVSSSADGDSDGVVDSRDNCIDVPNVDQVDRDQDGTGDVCDACPDARPSKDRDADGLDDACDPCVLGPQVDDDDDGVMDGCDLCPVTPSDNNDSDGDLVGMQCDEPFETRYTERVAFDPFTQLPDPEAWDGAAMWQLAGDGTSIAPVAASASLSWRDALEPIVSVQFDLASDGTTSVSFGSSVACNIDCIQGRCQLSAIYASMIVDASAQFASGRVTLRAEPPRTGTMLQFFNVTCDVFQRTDPAPITSSASSEQEGGRASLTITATQGTRVLGADVVR